MERKRKRKLEVEEEEATEQSGWNHGVKWLRGRMIGKGGFGSVFMATLKKPRSKFSCFPPVMAVKSAQVSASGSLQKEKEVLDHMRDCRFVIRCFGEEVTRMNNGGMIFNLLLEFASGGTLDDQIKISGNPGLPECDVKRYTKSILRGLDYIHSHGFVHCDLKPDNILLLPRVCTSSTPGEFMAKIGDLGLAKRVKGSKTRRLDPYLRGTSLYMAPEAVIDHIQEPPSDIWALGCVVLEMLTGQPPWQSNPDLNTDDLLRLISDETQLPKIPSEISKEGREFLRACFVRKPVYRFAADMLLNHPFLSGVADDQEKMDEETELVESDDENEKEAELRWSDYSDLEYASEEDEFSSCSWSEDFEEIEVSVDGSYDYEVKEGSRKRKRISSLKTNVDTRHVFDPLKRGSTIPAGIKI